MYTWNNIVVVLSVGADVVDWLETHVDGFTDRRDARKYASQMLKAGYIRHTVNKITFSEQCYYIFGDMLSSGLLLVKFYFERFSIKFIIIDRKNAKMYAVRRPGWKEGE